MKLSNDTIEQVAELMVKPLQERRDTLRATIEKQVANYLTELYVPAEVQCCASMYPQMVRNAPVYVKHVEYDDNLYLTPSIPCGDSFLKDFKTKSSLEAAKILSVYDLLGEYMHTGKLRKDTRNRIRCTLQGLRTEAKIKKEFPEAYEAYKIVMDMPSGTMCDNVEKLRAELSGMITKDKEVK